ncbi:MAG: hypothetical protein AAFR60_04160 [Pseudomonadota bacterium]
MLTLSQIALIAIGSHALMTVSDARPDIRLTDPPVVRDAEPDDSAPRRQPTRDPFARRSITVTGVVLSPVVGCPRIRASNGALYSLSYLPKSLRRGDRVRVRGTLQGVSSCMSGGMIAVSSVRRE